jgi:hypothetical protein
LRQSDIKKSGNGLEVTDEAIEKEPSLRLVRDFVQSHHLPLGHYQKSLPALKVAPKA